MPRLEVGFFDIDDIQQHPDFFKIYQGQWYYHRFGTDTEHLTEWYRDLFDEAEAGQLVGERSISYMASSVAPQRIHEMVPGAKLIFMIRDPVRRAYSNYWHLLRSGEATGSFERTLRYRTPVLFERGLYRRQLKRYLKLFSRDQILILIFEEFVKDPKKGLKAVCNFLGVNVDEIPYRSQGHHENRGRYPWSRRLQYAVNTLFFHNLLDGHRYIDTHLPRLRSDALGMGNISRQARLGVRLIFKVLSRINCSKQKRPRMKSETRDLLKYLYEDRNDGLSDIVGKDLSSIWPITSV